jgi:hypothetical protein
MWLTSTISALQVQCRLCPILSYACNDHFVTSTIRALRVFIGRPVFGHSVFGHSTSSSGTSLSGISSSGPPSSGTFHLRALQLRTLHLRALRLRALPLRTGMTRERLGRAATSDHVMGVGLAGVNAFPFLTVRDLHIVATPSPLSFVPFQPRLLSVTHAILLGSG